MVHGSMGFASTNILDRENVSKCILEAISMAKSVNEKLKKNIDFSSNVVSKEKWNATPKVDVNSIGFDEKEFESAKKRVRHER